MNFLRKRIEAKTQPEFSALPGKKKKKKRKKARPKSTVRAQKPYLGQGFRAQNISGHDDTT